MQVVEPGAMPAHWTFWRRALPVLGLFGAFVIATGCGSGEPDSDGEPIVRSEPGAPTATDGPPDSAQLDPVTGLPDGWSRVQVREGNLGRYTANPLIGFTIDLPPGWSATEARPSGDVLNGWIGAPLNPETGKVPFLRYLIGGGSRRSYDAITQDPRYEITELEIQGVSVVLRLAVPDAIDEGPQIGAFYEQIPGAPDGMIAPSLDIDGDSRGFDDQKLLGQILKSVRYSELSSLPERPVAVAIDTSDWVYSLARTDLQNSQWGAANFSLLLPPGWTTTEAWSIDSAIGTISGDGIELSYDYLGGVIDPHDPRAIADGLPGHNVWDEEVDGVLFSFIRPDSQEPDPRGTTGASITIPAFRDDGSSGAVRLPISGAGLDADQQELALAVLRTIRGVPYESAE